MSTSKKSDATSPHLIRAANHGQSDMQSARDGSDVQKTPQTDQSEGAKREGQPTAMHGKGAGFSRNTH